jgi:hypothetical protein
MYGVLRRLRLIPEPPSATATMPAEPSRHGLSRQFSRLKPAFFLLLIALSMYREHLLSIDHVQKRLYHQVDTPDGRRSLRAPPFFVAQTDKGFKGSSFPLGSEAERRISLFARSLATALPEGGDIHNALLVSHSWCECSVELLWYRPPYRMLTLLSS